MPGADACMHACMVLSCGRYLWSGQIDSDLYAYDCVFTDPTLSFTGLDTFERNIANLQPWLERLLRNERCELLGLELDEGACEVRASWLMAGDVALPWSPHVELTGAPPPFPPNTHTPPPYPGATSPPQHSARPSPTYRHRTPAALHICRDG